MKFLVVFIMGITHVLFVGNTLQPTNMVGETIPDDVLAKLYGGCGRYNDPYCATDGSDCPAYVPVNCEPLDPCRLCVPKIGAVCHDNWIPFDSDPDGCRDGESPCSNAKWSPVLTPWGYCGIGSCNENYDPTGNYPDCNTASYTWCDD